MSDLTEQRVGGSSAAILQSTIDAQSAHIGVLQAKIERYHNDAQVKAARIDALVAENLRLREALAPLAAIPVSEDAPDDYYVAWPADGSGRVTVGDVRRARAAALLEGDA